MSRKLSDYSRNTILQDVLNHGFGAKIAESNKAIREAGDALYDALVYKPNKRAFDKLAEAFPVGFFAEYSEAKFQIGKVLCLVQFSKKRPVFESWNLRSNEPMATIEADHPLAIAWAKANEAGGILAKEHKAAKDEAQAVIWACGSDTALIKTWPEIELFVRKIVPSDSNLPMIVDVSKVNKALDLPVKEEKK